MLLSSVYRRVSVSVVHALIAYRHRTDDRTGRVDNEIKRFHCSFLFRTIVSRARVCVGEYVV